MSSNESETYSEHEVQKLQKLKIRKIKKSKKIADLKLEKLNGNSCPTCFKSLSNGKSLRDHIRIHTGEKPYHCNEHPECKKTFRILSGLKQHVAIHHSDEKLFKCVICSKSFKLSQYLLIHKRTHEPADHQCSRCQKFFKTKKTLKRHILIMHKFRLDM